VVGIFPIRGVIALSNWLHAVGRVSASMVPRRKQNIPFYHIVSGKENDLSSPCKRQDKSQISPE
jgi:hypothetical protein